MYSHNKLYQVILLREEGLEVVSKLRKTGKRNLEMYINLSALNIKITFHACHCETISI